MACVLASPCSYSAVSRFPIPNANNVKVKVYLKLSKALTPHNTSTTLRRRRRNSVKIRAGLPVVENVPVLNVLLSPALLTAVYVLGAIRFLSGFSQTTYSDTFATRFGLAAMWPVLFLASKKFRDNFKRAVMN